MIARTAFGALAALTIGVGDASAQDNSGFQVSSEYAYFTASDHQSVLRRAIEAELRSDPAVAAGDTYLSLDIIGPGVEAARALDPDNPSWPDSEAMTPLCGIETGQRLWLMALDDGSGTPVDWTRQAMLFRAGPAMPVYAHLGPFAQIVMSRIAAAQGVTVKVIWTNNDAESLMEAKRAGNGFALIEARNANARGFALALDINGPGTPDAPAVVDLGISDLPEPVLTVNTPHEFVDLAAPAAWRACAGFGVQTLNQAQVYDWQAAIAALAEQFAEAELC